MTLKYVAKLPTPGRIRPFRYVYRAPIGTNFRRGSLTTAFSETAGSAAGVPKMVTRTTKVELKGGLRTGSAKFSRVVYLGTSKIPYEGIIAGGTRAPYLTKTHTEMTRSSRVRLGRVLRSFQPGLQNTTEGRALQKRYGSAIRGPNL